MRATRRFTRSVVLGLTVLCGSVYLPPGGSAHASKFGPDCPQPGAIPSYANQDLSTYPAGTKFCVPADFFTHNAGTATPTRTAGAPSRVVVQPGFTG